MGRLWQSQRRIPQEEACVCVLCVSRVYVCAKRKRERERGREERGNCCRRCQEDGDSIRVHRQLLYNIPRTFVLHRAPPVARPSPAPLVALSLLRVGSVCGPRGPLLVLGATKSRFPRLNIRFCTVLIASESRWTGLDCECRPPDFIGAPPTRLLVELDVVGREEAAVATAGAHPPALVHLLNVLNELLRVERNLVVAGCDG